MSIPTLLLFKNGNLVRKTTGFLPKEQLLDWIEE
jgi:thioredoxin-like negative regulator of GroEL